MDERGLTAYVVTLHTPTVVLAVAAGLFAAALVFALGRVRGRSVAARAWIAALWFVGITVVAYAGVCRLLDVRGFDAEAISLFP